MSKPLKILMFGWEFPPHNSGGLGVACQGLTRALGRLEVETIFVLPKRLSHDDIEDEDFKLRFADTENKYFIPRVIESEIISPYSIVSQSNLWYEEKRLNDAIYGNSLLSQVLGYARRAILLSKKETFDVIHAHDWLSFAAGIAVAEDSGKPLVVHFHATEFDRGAGNGVNQAVYEIEKEAVESADKIIAISEFMKNTLVKHYGANENKIEVIHNGAEKLDAEDDVYWQSKIESLLGLDRPMVLSMGRITIQKGLDYLVDSARYVKDYYTRFPEKKMPFFVIAGSGDMQEEIIEKTVRFGVADDFVFPGFVRGGDRERLFRGADLFIMPSVSEPFGLVALEAAQRDTPVLISRQSGVAEVLRNALVVDFWDTKDMANKIVSCIEHSAMSTTLSQESKEEVLHISWDKAAVKCVTLYKNLVSA